MGAKTSGKLTRIGAAPKKDDGKKDDAAKKGDDKKAGAAKLMVGSAIAATLLAMWSWGGRFKSAEIIYKILNIWNLIKFKKCFQNYILNSNRWKLLNSKEFYNDHWI